ncbi:MAG: hypothetical protein KDD67_12725 [Ignavibacteriae bacterium]|nr:hypothetical protein [Ignavibacteriota bacterium]MCB9214339.1 hypothetical protein [Ignavibacteria bacterium]
MFSINPAVYCTLSFFLIGYSSLLAQAPLVERSSLRVGITGGGEIRREYGAMEHFGFAFPFPFSDNGQPVFIDETGEGNSYAGGMLLEVQPSTLFALQLELLYVTGTTSWETELPSGKVLLPDPKHVVDQYHEVIGELTRSELKVSLFGLICIPNRWNIRGGLGPSLTFPLKLRESRRVQPGPNGATPFDLPGFPYPWHDSTYSENGTIENLNQSRLGIEAAIYGDIRLTERLSLSPSISAATDLSPIVQNSDWTIATFGANLTLFFDL